MSEPQLVVELSLSQTEAISSTSSNTPEGKGTESVPYSAKEDVVNVCKTDNNISSEVTESRRVTEARVKAREDMARCGGAAQTERTFWRDGPRKSAVCAATSTG